MSVIFDRSSFLTLPVRASEEGTVLPINTQAAYIMWVYCCS